MIDTALIAWQREDWHCAVVRGEFPVERIYEDDETIAFYAPEGHQLNEEYDVHAYVIPKRHVVTVLDLTPADAPLLQAMFSTVQTVAQKLRLDERGFYIRINVMPPFQHTGHIHIHLLSGERRN